MNANPQKQRALHMASEAVAIGVVAPVSVYIAATNPNIPGWQRVFLYGLAVSTLVVDGWLLAKWMDE